MITVVLFHNVQRECHTCHRPVMAIGDGRAHLDLPSADHVVTSVDHPADKIGYQDGHALVRVFELEHADTKTPARVADHLAKILRISPEFQDGRDADLSALYRKRDLRALALGDVILVGEYARALAVGGSRPVSGTFNEVLTGDWGSSPWASR